MSVPWLILIATALTLYGWFSDEQSILWGWSPFYLQMLTFPLALAFMTGFNPSIAPLNPDNSQDFWKVSSISFKLFLVMTAVTFLFFRLNRN